MAEGVFRKMVIKEGLDSKIQVSSAGLGDWHLGQRPHKDTLAILDKYEIPHDWMISKQLQLKDLETYDYIIAMDSKNVEGLQQFGDMKHIKVFKLLDLVEESELKDVPDPYYTKNFDEVYALVSIGCDKLLEKIKIDL